MSLDQEDWATWTFMRWFVKEQKEEETLAVNLLDKLRIAGGETVSSDALCSLDRDLGRTVIGAISAQDVTADNP